MVTKVLLKLSTPLHSALSVIPDNPPDGYEYIVAEQPLWEQSRSPLRVLASWLHAHPKIRKSLILVRERLSLFRPSSAALVLSLAPNSTFNAAPTLLFDNEAADGGASDPTLSRALLLRHNIKRILVKNETVARTYLSVLSESEMKGRVAVLRLGVAVPERVEHKRASVVRLLFVSSSNRGDRSWGDTSFYLRGGLDVLRSYRALNARYGPRVELVLCSQIPTRIRVEFGDVLSLPNVKVRGILGKADLDLVYRSCDMVAYPGYRGTATIAEAFGYGLPVVASDSWDLRDYVTDGHNGVVVHRDDSRTVISKNHLFYWYIDKIADSSDEGFSERYAEAVSRLIDNPDLRLKLGENARETVETGSFSIAFMKKELGRYFDEALAS